MKNLKMIFIMILKITTVIRLLLLILLLILLLNLLLLLNLNLDGQIYNAGKRSGNIGLIEEVSVEDSNMNSNRNKSKVSLN